MKTFCIVAPILLAAVLFAVPTPAQAPKNPAFAPVEDDPKVVRHIEEALKPK